MFKHYDADVLM